MEKSPDIHEADAARTSTSCNEDLEVVGCMSRHHEGKPLAAEEIPVDSTLEGDIAQVEQSIADYLRNPTDALRQSLLTTLEQLDSQTDRSDSYENSIIGSAAWGYASKGAVVGETSRYPIVDELQSTELKAQIDLVKAAKNEVRGPTPEAFAELQSASANLASLRGHQSAPQ